MPAYVLLVIRVLALFGFRYWPDRIACGVPLSSKYLLRIKPRVTCYSALAQQDVNAVLGGIRALHE
jgi:hypothetical protein